MKFSKKILLLSVCLSSFYNLLALPLCGRSFLSPRSQSTNAARDLVGWHRFINKDACGFYGALAATPQYGHSYRPNRIAEYFFGSDEICITGSQVENRDCTILADYFGLSPLFKSCVCISPQIRTGLIDFAGYWGYKSFYIRAHAPVVWTKWDFELCETIDNTGITTPFPALYMDSGQVTPPIGSFVEALQGGVTFGQVTEGIQFGRVCGSQTETKLSDIEVALGWNFINHEDGHAGFNIRFAAPAGTRPDGCFLFEPVVGNGHHWELGAGFTSQTVLWERNGDQFINIYFDLNAVHLFKARQRRSFDFCENGPLSRFILLKEFDETGNYTGSTIPAINRTTLCCDVRADVKFDIVIMASYLRQKLSVDFGYNAWIRSREKIDLIECLPENRFALKGIQNVALPVGLSNATQSSATIVGDNFADQVLVADPNPPVFINTEDINPKSAATSRQFTHKFFAHLSYSANNYCTRSRFVPYIGIGGEVEFESNRPRNDTEPNNNSISQWALWVKGGTSF